jgi:DNA polymerase-3 subunit gamma/tau
MAGGTAGGGPRAALAPRPRAEEAADADAAPARPAPASFPEVVALARAQNEMTLASHLDKDVHLVRFEANHIELRPSEQAPRNLAGRLGDFLQQATGARWVVSVSQETGEPPLRDQARAQETALRDAALAHPLVQAAMAAFPGAKLVDRRGAPAAAGVTDDPGETNEGDDNS